MVYSRAREQQILGCIGIPRPTSTHSRSPTTTAGKPIAPESELGMRAKGGKTIARRSAGVAIDLMPVVVDALIIGVGDASAPAWPLNAIHQFHALQQVEIACRANKSCIVELAHLRSVGIGSPRLTLFGNLSHPAELDAIPPGRVVATVRQIVCRRKWKPLAGRRTCIRKRNSGLPP